MSRSVGVGLQLRLDPVACDAFGYCADLLPERCTLDEWGYPMVDATPVSGELVALARQTAASCPRRALLLETVVATDPRSAKRSGADGARRG